MKSDGKSFDKAVGIPEWVLFPVTWKWRRHFPRINCNYTLVAVVCGQDELAFVCQDNFICLDLVYKQTVSFFGSE